MKVFSEVFIKRTLGRFKQLGSIELEMYTAASHLPRKHLNPYEGFIQCGYLSKYLF